MQITVTSRIHDALAYFYDMKQRIPGFFRNKYIIATAAFLLWVMFINDIDIFYVMRSHSDLQAMKSEVERLDSETATAAEALHDLDNPANLEKFARETYFLQRPNEDVYIIRSASN